MTDEASPLLDPMHVADLVALDKGKGAVFAQFVDLFVSGTGERIAQLRRHSDAGDMAALADAAHALRGASGNVGAMRLAGLLERIEVCAKARDAAGAGEGVALLDAAYAPTRSALLAATGRMPPDS